MVSSPVAFRVIPACPPLHVRYFWLMFEATANSQVAKQTDSIRASIVDGPRTRCQQPVVGQKERVAACWPAARFSLAATDARASLARLSHTGPTAISTGFFEFIPCGGLGLFFCACGAYFAAFGANLAKRPWGSRALSAAKRCVKHVSEPIESRSSLGEQLRTYLLK